MALTEFDPNDPYGYSYDANVELLKRNRAIAEGLKPGALQGATRTGRFWAPTTNAQMYGNVLQSVIAAYAGYKNQQDADIAEKADREATAKAIKDYRMAQDPRNFMPTPEAPPQSQEASAEPVAQAYKVNVPPPVEQSPLEPAVPTSNPPANVASQNTAPPKSLLPTARAAATATTTPQTVTGIQLDAPTYGEPVSVLPKATSRTGGAGEAVSFAGLSEDAKAQVLQRMAEAREQAVQLMSQTGRGIS